MDLTLRRLMKDDAFRMLEWMHDETKTSLFFKDFRDFTLDDCRLFIEDSLSDNSNIHFCISFGGLYEGTVSLKHITDLKSAEFAIVLHPDARGKGIGNFALNAIINYGFQEKQLDFIYWSVRGDNLKAIRLYDRNGYERSTVEMIENRYGGGIPGYTAAQKRSLAWYMVTREEKDT